MDLTMLVVTMTVGMDRESGTSRDRDGTTLSCILPTSVDVWRLANIPKINPHWQFSQECLVLIYVQYSLEHNRVAMNIAHFFWLQTNPKPLFSTTLIMR